MSKSQGSSNPHNVVKATFDALLQLEVQKLLLNKEEYQSIKFLIINEIMSKIRIKQIKSSIKRIKKEIDSKSFGLRGMERKLLMMIQRQF